VSSTAIVWFRRDLRVHDHPALCAALEQADGAVPCFCFDDRLLHGRHEPPHLRGLRGVAGARFVSRYHPRIAERIAPMLVDAASFAAVARATVCSLVPAAGQPLPASLDRAAERIGDSRA
jgi:hypothetical protein